MEQQPNCANCIYYDGVRDSDNPHANLYGECRRYPPQQKRPGSTRTRFPTVGAKDWCGEYKEHWREYPPLIKD